MTGFIDLTQRLGRSLMLPIAVLPVAGLLLRLGQPDLLDIAPVAAAGQAIFYDLGLLFAIGIAVGLARENHGAAGLAGAVAYLVATKGAEVLLDVPAGEVAAAAAAAHDLAIAEFKRQALHRVSVPMGILAGIVSGALYNRYHDIKLPDYLAFFAGRRFVPIVAGLAGIGLAFAFGLGYPAVARGMDALSYAVIASGPLGLFIYGVLNRILIVTGLHHILNNVAWFIVGNYHGATGDLNRFFAGDPSAGAFMSGFFPVMMFGLPAACFAMYRTAPPAKRLAAGGLLFSMALTSFLTGVTEPIEFAFMFLAPALYVLHALLTGLAMVLMDLAGCHLGFGFSAGLFDYVLNFKKATHPLYLLPIGALYAFVYYFAFRYAIVRFDLATPGRGPDDAAPPSVRATRANAPRAEGFVAALGGADNLAEVEACTTRLRLVLRDRARVDAAALRALGSSGMIEVGAAGLQVVVGPIADQVASEIRAELAQGRPAAPATDVTALLEALGGVSNVRKVEAAAGRVLVDVNDGDRVDPGRLRALLERGAALTSKPCVHLLYADAQGLASAIRHGLG